MLALRADRLATMRQVLEDLTDDQLNAHTVPSRRSRVAPPDRYPVRECLRCVLHEEYHHRLYAERDLAVLESRTQNTESE